MQYPLKEINSETGESILKGVLYLWALFLRTLCIFSKNKATLDKVSYESDQKGSKEVKNQFSFSRDHCCEVTVKNVRKSIFSHDLSHKSITT